MAECEHTGEVVLQAELYESLGDDLVQLRLDLALLEELGLCGWIILHAVELLFKLDREGDDVSGKAPVLGDPLGYGRQVLALLSEVVLHCQVDEIDSWLGGDELYFFVDERDLGRCPASVSNWLIILQHLSHDCEHLSIGCTHETGNSGLTSRIFVVVSVKRGSILYLPPAFLTINSSATIVFCRISEIGGLAGVKPIQRVILTEILLAKLALDGS